MSKKDQRVNLGGWKRSIREAKRQIKIAQIRIAQLEGAVVIMRENERNGEPFPVEQGDEAVSN